MRRYSTVLSVAGSDSCGGAGIQADIKTCTALGTYAMTAVTALTAQNTCGVTAVAATASEMLAAQLQAIITDIRPDAVKTGMIPTAEQVGLVADFVRRHDLKNLVVDPVMVATSGDSLCENEARTTFLKELLPLARVVTPNIPEAQELTGITITGKDSMLRAARELLRLTGCGSVLLKGGHTDEDGRHADLLLPGQDEKKSCPATRQSAGAVWLEHEHIDTPNTHGTGCSLSSAVASFLACGLDVREAVSRAVSWLAGAIRAGKDYELGSGHGPVNHLYKISQTWK